MGANFWTGGQEKVCTLVSTVFHNAGRALQSPRPALISLDSVLWEVFDVAAIHCLICLDLDREPSDSSITISESNAIALEGLGCASQC
jgi:hypothetical protein